MFELGDRNVRGDSRQTKVGESGLDVLDKLLPDAVLEIELLVRVPLVDRGVSANRADIDHAVPELDESSSLNGDVKVGNVVQEELDKLLVRLLADPLDKALRSERCAHTVCGQTVLGEAEVEKRSYGNRCCAELFLLLDHIGAADVSNGDLVSESGEELKHFRGD